MRRAAAIVLGTFTGTALLVGAKYGTTSTTTSATASVDGVDVVTGPGGVPGTSSGTQSTSPGAAATPTATTGLPGSTNPNPSPTPRKTTTAPAPPASGLKDGTYKASAPVSGGDQGTLSMTVTISGGKVTAIAASENGGEPNCYRSACPTLIPEALSAQSANVAAVSHATHTSTAFKAALSAVLTSAKA